MTPTGIRSCCSTTRCSGSPTAPWCGSIARWRCFAGPEVALGEVNDLALSLEGYHLYHSTRAELLDQLGEKARAREARVRALELCRNPAERSRLERKLLS
jgi:predicted RNA polymerase sigma factor